MLKKFTRFLGGNPKSAGRPHNPADRSLLDWVAVMEQSPVYEGFDWKTQHFRDFVGLRLDRRMLYEPFILWRLDACAYDTIHIDSLGRRKSWGPESLVKGGPDIAVFGGSTVFGTGVTDNWTLPYLLGRHLEASLPSVRTQNYGCTAYNSNQDLLVFLREVKAGRRPDLAIFYQGVNEVYGGMFSPAVPEWHLNLLAMKQRFELRDGGGDVDWADLCRVFTLDPRSQRIVEVDFDSVSLERRAQGSLENYLANIKIIRAVAEHHGIETLFFWQPCLLHAKPHTHDFEARLISNPDYITFNEKRGEFMRQCVTACYRLAQNMLPTNDIVYLGDAFASYEEPLYIDWCHLGPKGTDMIARLVASHCLPRLG